MTTVAQPLEHYAWIDDSHLFANMQPSYADNGAGYETQNPGAAEALFAQGV